MRLTRVLRMGHAGRDQQPGRRERAGPATERHQRLAHPPVDDVTVAAAVALGAHGEPAGAQLTADRLHRLGERAQRRQRAHQLALEQLVR